MSDSTSQQTPPNDAAVAATNSGAVAAVVTAIDPTAAIGPVASTDDIETLRSDLTKQVTDLKATVSAMHDTLSSVASVLSDIKSSNYPAAMQDGFAAVVSAINAVPTVKQDVETAVSDGQITLAHVKAWANENWSMFRKYTDLG